jgi:hypothetical protein
MSFLSVCCGIGACASLARGREAGKAHTPLEQHWQIPGTALYTKRRSEPRPHPCVRHRPTRWCGVFAVVTVRVHACRPTRDPFRSRARRRRFHGSLGVEKMAVESTGLVTDTATKTTRNCSPDLLLFGVDFDVLQGVVDFDDTESLPTSSGTSTPSLIPRIDRDPNDAHDTNVSVPTDPEHLPPLQHLQHLLSLPSPFDATSPATDNDFTALFAWATSRGALLDAVRHGRDAYGGHGLFTTRPVRKGDVVATLPRELRVGQRLACQTLPRLPPNTPHLSALSLLLLHFSRAVETDWNIYIRTLPRRGQFHNAILVNDAEQTRSAPDKDAYAQACADTRRLARNCEAFIRDCLLDSVHDTSRPPFTATTVHESSPALEWAVAMVLSRSHGFGSTDGGRWMTPVLDLANHQTCKHGGGKLESDDQGRLIFRAGKDLACGDEVTLDYQLEHDSDARILATYGFSLPVS